MMGTTIKAMLNTDRVLNNGSYPLVIRLIHNRKKKVIYTPYHLFQSDFDTGAQKITYRKDRFIPKKQADEINRYLREKMSQLERIVIQLDKGDQKEYGIEEILAKYNSLHASKFLIAYFANEITSMQLSGRFGSAILYASTMNSIKRFTKGEKIKMKDINYRFISNYMWYLRSTGISQNTINMYLRNLRSVYNKATKEGIVHNINSPFSDFKIGVTQTVKRALSKDCIRLIAKHDFSYDLTLELARDIFMFSFYTRGMSLVDMIYLTHSDIISGVIYYKRNKTGQPLQVAVTEPLQKIIDKYRSNTMFVLPFLTDESSHSRYKQYRNALNTINHNLKRIGMILGLKHKLTTYVARHSWATIAKTEGIPITTISEGLGHTTETTTKIYLREFDRSVIDQANAKIILL